MTAYELTPSLGLRVASRSTSLGLLELRAAAPSGKPARPLQLPLGGEAATLPPCQF
jgi:hypothetical protein